MPIPDDCLTHSISPLDIKRLAMHDPIVLACYRAWETGHMSWDQALMHAVAALSEVLPADRVTVRYGEGDMDVERCVGIFEDTRKEHEDGRRL